MARRVSRGAVHFGGVLAGKGAAAVGALAAIGIHDDLATGEAGIAVRAADDEFAGRVDVILDVVA